MLLLGTFGSLFVPAEKSKKESQIWFLEQIERVILSKLISAIYCAIKQIGDRTYSLVDTLT